MRKPRPIWIIWNNEKRTRTARGKVMCRTTGTRNSEFMRRDSCGLAWTGRGRGAGSESESTCSFECYADQGPMGTACTLCRVYYRFSWRSPATRCVRRTHNVRGSSAERCCVTSVAVGTRTACRGRPVFRRSAVRTSPPPRRSTLVRAAPVRRDVATTVLVEPGTRVSWPGVAVPVGEPTVECLIFLLFFFLFFCFLKH